jgi:hypothetical protein
MVARTHFTVAVLLIAAAPVAAEEKLPTPADVRKAVEKSLPYLEEEGLAWMERRSATNPTGCVSCHRVAFMVWSHDEARRRGFAVDADKVEKWTAWALERMTARGKEGGGLDTMSQMILARDPAAPWTDKPAAKREGSDHFLTLWENIVERQRADGSWPPEGQLTSPAEVTTGWAILALASRDGKGKTSATSRERALAFLEKTKPDDSTEALLLRFLVERRFGKPERAAELRKELLGRQNTDGGWAYRNGGKESDAFAAGQVLYALSEAGLDGSDPIVRRAWKFLVSTQSRNGSWIVPTSAIHVGKGQKTTEAWIRKTDEVYTYWGSGWATIGLLRTLPAKGTEKEQRKKD